MECMYSYVWICKFRHINRRNNETALRTWERERERDCKYHFVIVVVVVNIVVRCYLICTSEHMNHLSITLTFHYVKENNSMHSMNMWAKEYACAGILYSFFINSLEKMRQRRKMLSIILKFPPPARACVCIFFLFFFYYT